MTSTKDKGNDDDDDDDDGDHKTTMRNRRQEAVTATPNEFVVRSRLYQRRSMAKTLLPVTAVLFGLVVLDSDFHHWGWWLLGSFLLALIVIATGPQKEQVEVVVTIYPLLGIVQLATWNNDRLRQGGGGAAPRVLPLEQIHDCIVQEYVGAFQVTTHVVFRLAEEEEKQQQQQTCPKGSSTTDPTTLTTTITTSTTRLEPAFPGMELSFAQCWAMKNQIQRALDLAKTTTTATTTAATNWNGQPKT
jgi:hypothetical protein